MSAKLLVLGLDAFDPALVSQWVAESKLPAIRALMDRGTTGLVHGVHGFYVGSTWPSFYTGLGPAGHGFYRVEQLEPGGYGFFRPLDKPDGLGGTPFWTLASGAGRRTAVLDVPLTRLDTGLDGIHVVEWGGHDAVFGFSASPSTLKNEILGSVGEYPVPSDCDAHRTTVADFDAFVGELERAVERKTALTLDLIERDDWDLFVQVFTESHCVGHQCWHLHDPTHPAHDPVLAAELGDPLERVYRALDRAVGTIIQRAEGTRHVLLLSLHGMDAYRGANFLLPEILYQLGVTVRPVISQQPERDRSLSGVVRAAARRLPHRVRESLRPLRAQASLREASSPAGVSEWADVRTSKCFPIPNGAPVSGIRLNVADREPQGVLQPGAEATAFSEELTLALLDIVDERTGAPLIAAVDRTDSLYIGPRLGALPDLLVTWSDAVATGTAVLAAGRGATIRARSPKIGVVEGRNGYGRTGEHVPRGLFVLAGPGVPILERRDAVQVTDFHPTICRLLGLPTPSVDGVVISGLISTGL